MERFILEGSDFIFEQRAPLSSEIVVIVILACYSAIFLPISFLFWKRRKHPMFAKRSIFFVSAFCWYLFIFSWHNGMSIIFGKPSFCISSEVLYAFTPSVSFSFLMGIPNLILLSEMNAAKLKRGQFGTRSWVWSFAKLFSLRGRVGSMVVIQITVLLVMIALYYLTELSGDCNRVSLLVFAGYVIIFFGALSLMGLRLLKLSDPYFMKLEILFALIPGAPTVLISILYPIFPSIFPSWFDIRWNILPLSIGCFVFSMLLPVMLTFPRFLGWLERKSGMMPLEAHLKIELETKANLYAHSRDQELLEAILETPILMDAFTSFLVEEWCVENILFYQAVVEFRRGFSSSQDDFQLAKKIMREYVDFHAPLEINLDFALRRKLVEKIERTEITAELFDEAQKIIYDLVSQNSFPRWQRTLEYKSAIESVMDDQLVPLKVHKNSLGDPSVRVHVQNYRLSRLSLAEKNEEIQF